MKTPAPLNQPGTLSSVPDAARLPAITQGSWELGCTNVAERNALLAYAEQHKIAIWADCWERPFLWLEWWEGRIWANPDEEYKESQLTPDQFKDMCDAYATPPVIPSPEPATEGHTQAN